MDLLFLHFNIYLSQIKSSPGSAALFNSKGPPILFSKLTYTYNNGKIIYFLMVLHDSWFWVDSFKGIYR